LNETEIQFFNIEASMARLIRSLTLNNLSFIAVGSNSAREFGFFLVRKLSS
jgi:hypothetical protein